MILATDCIVHIALILATDYIARIALILANDCIAHIALRSATDCIAHIVLRSANDQATLFQHDPQLPVRKQAEQRQDSTHWGGNGDNNPGGDLNNEDPLVGSHQQETQETNPDANKDKPSPGDNNSQVTQASQQRSSTFSKDRGCKILTGGPSSHQVLVIISLFQSLSLFYSH